MGFRNNLPLLKFVKSVKISFDPFDKASGAARMMMIPFSTENARKANEKLKVDVDVGSHIKTPSLDVTYADGKLVSIPAGHLPLDELEKTFFRHAIALRNKEEGI